MDNKNQFAELTIDANTFGSSELDWFTQKHTVLISSTETQAEHQAADSDSASNSCTLHYWSRHGSGSDAAATLLTALPLDATQDGLQYVAGFAPLGSFHVYVPSGKPLVQALHHILSSLLQESPGDGRLEDERTIRYVVENIAVQKQDLNEPPIPSEKTVLVHLSTLEILSTAEEKEGTSPFNHPELLWKWAKPESAYDKKSGLWEPTAGGAIVDGEWAAGRGFKLLVQGLSSDQKERLVGQTGAKAVTLPRDSGGRIKSI